ncbi:hypothetical protein UMZ34_09945 [Halopseudomonas pachastrellae]|nr:hypothetical protein UMZ34_09945 [Halopseudomonas pachastrellae]
MSVGSELLNAPFPLIVRNLGVGIAEAQLELDLVSLRIARMMAGFPTGSDEEEDGPRPPTRSSSATASPTACWSWALPPVSTSLSTL